jgi:ATP phosphoribosyltransferase regulatory subunit
MNGNWLLPEHLADVLPAEARRVEDLRRTLLDLFRTRGFETVSPPMLEYIDPLLTGAGEDLNLKTFKLVDQLSGRTLGLRADMTPQITRIDTHLLNRPGVTRLCYCGPVLHARPTGLLASRELLQIGAEIFGYAGVQADLEIIRLAARSLSVAGLSVFQVVLCHDGLVKALIESDAAALARADEIIALLRDKDLPGLACLEQGLRPLARQTIEALKALPRLYGSREVLGRAREVLPKLPGVTAALDQLITVFDAHDDLEISVDLADTGAYGYHCGVTFSFYAPGWHDALVRGGRYDNVSLAFGRARPATGFSMDLRRVAQASGPAPRALAILAPADDATDLSVLVEQLRQQGEIVVQLFPGETAQHDEFVFDRELAFDGQQWVMRAV